MTEGELIIHSDGGARGNPGPAACAFVIELSGKILYKGSLFLGSKTNNFAEYQGVLIALKYLIANPDLFAGKRAIFYLDSELVVRQLLGLYRIKSDILKTVNQEIKKLISTNKIDVVFKNIPRTQNKIADYLVNQELDRKT